MTEMWKFCENKNIGRISNTYHTPCRRSQSAVRFTTRKAFRNIAKNNESKK